jgi:hypothetical protein
MNRSDFVASLPTTVKIEGDFLTRKVWINGKLLKPGPSQKVWNHSPDGFNWGYGGSGPAQLALAILLLFVDPETAQQYHQDFKFCFVASLPQETFCGSYNLRDTMAKKYSLDKNI